MSKRTVPKSDFKERSFLERRRLNKVNKTTLCLTYESGDSVSTNSDISYKKYESPGTIRMRESEEKKRIQKQLIQTSRDNKRPCESFTMPVINKKKKQVERKRAAKVTDVAKKSPSPVSSVTVAKKVESKSSSAIEITPTNPNHKSFEHCMHCGSVAYLCHDYKYSQNCIKACHHYLHDNTHHWTNGFSPARMMTVFVTAYNKIRKADLELRFSFYEKESLEVPRCMHNSMRVAVDLGYNQDIMDQLQKDNDAGREDYFQAKREHHG